MEKGWCLSLWSRWWIRMVYISIMWVLLLERYNAKAFELSVSGGIKSFLAARWGILIARMLGLSSAC